MAIVVTTPGAPSSEGAVTAVAICPAFSVPACLVHPDKQSLLLWGPDLKLKGLFYSGGRRQKELVKRELKIRGGLWSTCWVDVSASGWERSGSPGR